MENIAWVSTEHVPILLSGSSVEQSCPIVARLINVCHRHREVFAPLQTIDGCQPQKRRKHTNRLYKSPFVLQQPSRRRRAPRQSCCLRNFRNPRQQTLGLAQRSMYVEQLETGVTAPTAAGSCCRSTSECGARTRLLAYLVACGLRRAVFSICLVHMLEPGRLLVRLAQQPSVVRVFTCTPADCRCLDRNSKLDGQLDRPVSFVAVRIRIRR